LHLLILDLLRFREHILYGREKEVSWITTLNDGMAAKEAPVFSERDELLR
jgi:hypothetical protein